MKDDYDIEQNDSGSQGGGQVVVNDQYWREKEKTQVHTRVNAHQCIIAHKSSFFSQFFKEKHSKQSLQDDKLIIDFQGNVQYEAFRKILDYIYLDDLNVLDSVSDSTEMIEVIKLAKLYKLETLFKACEQHFKELMVQSFDCSNLISLKQSSNSSAKLSVRKQAKADEQ